MSDQDNKKEKDKKSFFGDFMFRGIRPNKMSLFDGLPKGRINLFSRRRTEPESLPSIPPESLPSIPIEEPEKEEKIQPAAKVKKTSKGINMKCYETISGNYILTRGWDGNNMWVFRMRKRRKK
nr:hypothetical protein [Neobacillus sp. Marseille-Q6967]